MRRRALPWLLLLALALAAARAARGRRAATSRAPSAWSRSATSTAPTAEFVAVLRLAGLVDEKEHWSGGQTHFVQTGDLLDRGSDTRQVLELLMRLEGEAKKAGGRVHALLGNHEVMNLLGDLRYVSREEYKAFETPESQHLLRAALPLARGSPRARRRRRPSSPSTRPASAASSRSTSRSASSSGTASSRTRAATASGCASARRSCKIGGVAFLHGGLTPEVAALGCEAINATVRREITSDLEKTRENPAGVARGGRERPALVPWHGARGRDALAAVARARAHGDRRAGRGDRTHRHERRPHHAALRRPRGDDRRRDEPALRAQPGRARDRVRRER